MTDIELGKLVAKVGVIIGWTPTGTYGERLELRGGPTGLQEAFRFARRLVPIGHGRGLKCRLVITGIYPREPSLVPSDMPEPTITVSAERNEIEIAEEIKRRFLPFYRLKLQDVVDWIKQDREATAARKLAKQQVREALGLDPDAPWLDFSAPGILSGRFEMEADFEPQGFTIDIRYARPDCGVQIAKLIKTLIDMTNGQSYNGSILP